MTVGGPDPGLVDYDTAAPLATESVVAADDGVVRRTHHWINGHRERVPVVVTAPSRPAGPRPAVLIGHGATTTKDALYIQGAATRWAAAGLTCIAADAPRHGERARPRAPFQAATLRGGWRAGEFFRDHVVDHRRVLDFAGTLPEIDSSRLAYLGFSMGTLLGVPLVAVDHRLGAACFVIGGSYPLGPATPALWAPLIAPRPVLQLNTTSDAVFPERSVRTLHDALGEPKELRLFPGTHVSFGGSVYKAMWDFLAAHLAP